MKQYESFPLIPIARGNGAWLYDNDGNRYLDCVSSWWVNLFGHCNPRINAAITEQMGKLEHVMLAGFTHEPVVELSERLRAIAPAGLGHCFYGSDGASATEIALKMSSHFWREQGRIEKNGFLSLENSYHGETLGALSVTDIHLFRDAYGALIKQHATIQSPDWRKAEPGESAQDYAIRCADVLEEHVSRHHAQLAAFIVEPLVQGATGMAMYHPEYLRRAREICDTYGVHLIADEIAVGMGRSGTMFACEQAQITPDFLLISKGITGGYLPLSVVMTRDEIYQVFYTNDFTRGFLHSHSYTGNPLACRAALATLDIFATDGVLVQNIEKARLFNRLAEPLRVHQAVRHWRNTGMIWAFEVENTGRDFAQRCFAQGLRQELLLRPIGNTIYFMPPYVVDEMEMELFVQGVLRIINELGREP